MESLSSERINKGLNTSALLLSALAVLGACARNNNVSLHDDGGLDVADVSSHLKNPEEVVFDPLNPANMVKIFNGAALEIVKDGYVGGCQGFLIKDDVENRYYVRTIRHCISGVAGVTVKFKDVTGNVKAFRSLPRSAWVCSTDSYEKDPGCSAELNNSFMKKLYYKKGIKTTASYFGRKEKLYVGQYVIMPNRETNQWFVFKILKVESDKFYIKSIGANAVSLGFGVTCQGNSGAAVFVGDFDVDSGKVSFKLKDGRPVVVGELSGGVVYPGDDARSWKQDGRQCGSEALIAR